MSTTTKPDLYTKIVLTVIAVCLVCLCVNNISLTSPAHAQDMVDVTNMSLSEWANRDAPAPPQVMAVRIVGIDLPGGLPVTVSKAPTTPVQIVGVNVPSAWMPHTLPVTFPTDTNWPTLYRKTATRR